MGVLQRTGVRFESKKALRLFEKNGCIVDQDKRLVKFPPHLVEECLRITPSGFYWKARDPKNDLIVGGNTVYFCPSRKHCDPTPISDCHAERERRGNIA
jgi:trimethylamine--corrinoid protein Co-methyltransferase